jgi:hypothetical protein
MCNNGEKVERMEEEMIWMLHGFNEVVQEC